MNLLNSLADFVFPPREDAKFLRTLDEGIVASLVRPVLISETRPPTTALLSFGDERVRALVHEAKYFDSRKAQELLASALREYLIEFETDHFLRSVLVPLPLSLKRLRERGFNQCERIASLALPHPSLVLRDDLLVRVKETEHQTRLRRAERIQNMKNAFAVSVPLDPAITYILFDDVVTTGATMQAGIEALLKGGAREVFPFALAYAD